MISALFLKQYRAEVERDQSAEFIWLLCVCPQGPEVAAEEEQLLATGSPPREWGKDMFGLFLSKEEIMMVIPSTYPKINCVGKKKI